MKGINMTKRTITETIEEYDTNGNLIRKVTTKTEEDENISQNPLTPTTYPWIYPWTTPWISPWATNNPEVTYST